MKYFVIVVLLFVSAAEISAQDAVFDAISYSHFKEVQFSSSTINGDKDSNGLIQPGVILLYKTKAGRVGKLKIQHVAANNNLVLKMFTYDSVGNTYSKNDSIVVPGTWGCDLDSGKVASSSPARDFFWSISSEIKRTFGPTNGAQFIFYDPSFESLSLAMIKSNVLFETPIFANNDSTNRLTEGSIVYYRTSEARYGKFKLIKYHNNGLVIKWVTFDTVGIRSYGDSLYIPGTWLCDLDSGKIAASGTHIDVKWNLQSQTIRSLNPLNGAKIGLARQQVLMVENFDFASGDSLNGKNGWEVYVGGVPMNISTAGLSFANYSGSNLGKSLEIVGGVTQQHLFKKFSPVDTGSIYLSFLVRVSNNNANDGYIAVLGNPTAGNYRAAVYTKIVGGQVFFGARATIGGSVQTYDPTPYLPNTTYLLTLKYTFIQGSNNDHVRLYVSTNTIPANEPLSANVGPLSMGALEGSFQIGSVLVTPGGTSASALNGATILIDGIRVSRTWEGTTLTSVKKNESVVLPTSISLEQNYPNPFNPSTVISYQIPMNGLVTLKVYDVIGREVETLVSEVHDAGSYSVTFNASKLSSGIYFVRLTSSGKVHTKKMMLMK